MGAQLQQPLQQTPLQDQPQQQPNFAAAVQQLNGHTSNTPERRSIPSPSPSLPGSIKQPTSQPSHFPGAPMGSNLAAASSSNDTEGLPTLKSIAQEATNRAGLKVPASAQQTQLSIGTTAPTISNSGLFPNPPSKDRSQKTEGHIPRTRSASGLTCHATPAPRPPITHNFRRVALMRLTSSSGYRRRRFSSFSTTWRVPRLSIWQRRHLKGSPGGSTPNT